MQIQNDDLRALAAKPGSAGLNDCLARIDAWLCDPSIEGPERQEISELVRRGDVAELRERFYMELEFGTGGIRGVRGAGTNRLNRYVVRRAVQGLANYILKSDPGAAARGVAIAHDSRISSDEFALEAALTLAANGVRAWLFPTLQTTPCLSFAVRHLHCVSGICVTASHNPPQYNGFKIYWEDGAQVSAPQDKGLLEEVFQVKEWAQAKRMTRAAAVEAGLLRSVPAEVEEAYFATLDGLKTFAAPPAPVKIVYTPLHGTGAVPARTALARWGYRDLFVVPEQAEPDGNFPTVAKPNPEERAALALALKHAARLQADCAMANDPDSDRLAVVVRCTGPERAAFADQAEGDFVFLNGNQTGALLIDHVLRRAKATGKLHPDHRIVKTIVTSDLHTAIAAQYGVPVDETLTGFKWIAALIRPWGSPSAPGKRYLFGTEESYGYMPGDYVRDKDGIGALCQGAEMVAALKSEGKNACSRLLELFAEHGAWADDLINVDLEGEAGAARIKRIMASFREGPDAFAFGGAFVPSAVLDFQAQTIRERKAGGYELQQHAVLPRSDVLQVRYADGSKLSMRPSGTEPKLKFYLQARVPVGQFSDGAEGRKLSLARIQSLRAAVTEAVSHVH